MAYSTPQAASYPTCGDKQDDVTKDLQQLAQLTTRLRSYSMDCDQGSLILDGIAAAKLELGVYLGVWVDPANATTFTRQLKTLTDVLTKSKGEHVLGISVGNEVLLNAGDKLATVTTGLLANIKTVRDSVKALNLGKDIPVGNGEAGSMITLELAEACAPLRPRAPTDAERSRLPLLQQSPLLR